MHSWPIIVHYKLKLLPLPKYCQDLKILQSLFACHLRYCCYAFYSTYILKSQDIIIILHNQYSFKISLYISPHIYPFLCSSFLLPSHSSIWDYFPTAWRTAFHTSFSMSAGAKFLNILFVWKHVDFTSFQK